MTDMLEGWGEMERVPILLDNSCVVPMTFEEWCAEAKLSPPDIAADREGLRSRWRDAESPIWVRNEFLAFAR